MSSTTNDPHVPDLFEDLVEPEEEPPVAPPKRTLPEVP